MIGQRRVGNIRGQPGQGLTGYGVPYSLAYANCTVFLTKMAMERSRTVNMMARSGSIAQDSFQQRTAARRDDLFLSCSLIPGCVIDWRQEFLNEWRDFGPPGGSSGR